MIFRCTTDGNLQKMFWKPLLQFSHGNYNNNAATLFSLQLQLVYAYLASFIPCSSSPSSLVFSRCFSIDPVFFVIVLQFLTSISLSLFRVILACIRACLSRVHTFYCCCYVYILAFLCLYYLSSLLRLVLHISLSISLSLPYFWFQYFTFNTLF